MAFSPEYDRGNVHCWERIYEDQFILINIA